jgi:NitT/TauT family transport system substrate-binding protein
MIRRLLVTLPLIAISLMPGSTQALAQERVTVGTQRLATSGALFLAAVNGYFKAEGLDVEMTAYTSPQLVVEALAGGSTDFAVAAFTGAAFNLAGKGAIKAIAASVREKRDYEGNELVASNAAYSRGLQKADALGDKSFSVGELGSPYHYQLGQIARIKKFDFASVTLKPASSLDAMARAIATGEADAAILPAQYARELLTANQAKLVAWVSEIDEPQLGALFASAKTIAGRRETVEKFLRAYRRGAAEYNAALMRNDKYSKRIVDAKSKAAATAIARYVYPNQSSGAATVEAGAYYMDPQAKLDTADVERQVEWLKSQRLIDSSVTARNVVDLSFR